MYVDLHIHSYYSDGSQSPEEIVAAARGEGLSAISVCDHNSVEAYGALRGLCEGNGIRLVRGVELDVVWEGLTLHLLGYNFDPCDRALAELIRHSRHEIEKQSGALIKNMEKDFPVLSPAEYAVYEYKRGRGGWKGINYLLDKGVTENIMEGTAYYPTYCDYAPKLASLEESCEIIKDAGGVPVLAHPNLKLERYPPDLDTTFAKLARQGVQGIECYYPAHTEDFTRRCVSFCRSQGLRITCGCDGHGRFGNPGLFRIGIKKADSSFLDLQGILE